MKRLKLIMQYDGSQFHGFQRQKEKDYRTVQSVLESQLRRLLGEEVTIHGSGRTDRGVHARGQVAHVDIQTDITPNQLQYALNRALPADLAISQIEEVNLDFHARKSTLGKWYSYDIQTSKERQAIGHMYRKHEPMTIDEDLFIQAFKPLLGHHSFRGFCGKGASVRTYERTIYLIAVQKQLDGYVVHFIGDGFLRKMVRNIVGSALDIGCKRRKADIILNALQTNDRTSAGTTAQANGLFLEEVFYDQETLALKINKLKKVSKSC